MTGNDMSSLRSPTQSKLHCITTEFTFCNASNINGNEHPFVFSPSFGPKTESGCNCSSPPTMAARNKIMGMMSNLRESSHESSLNEIFIDDHIENARFMVEQKRSFKGKKTIRRKHPISRSVSLDTGVFMLKMFLPISLGSKKFQSSSRMRSNKSNNKPKFANTKSRSAELAPGCWFINTTWKPKRQKGCIF